VLCPSARLWTLVQMLYRRPRNLGFLPRWAFLNRALMPGVSPHRFSSRWRWLVPSLAPHYSSAVRPPHGPPPGSPSRPFRLPPNAGWRLPPFSARGSETWSPKRGPPASIALLYFGDPLLCPRPHHPFLGPTRRASWASNGGLPSPWGGKPGAKAGIRGRRPQSPPTAPGFLFSR